MKKKGQAAMEFLMTYGWAILAAIIVIGVLAIYFRPQSIGANNAVISQPLYAQTWGINGNTNVTSLDIKNNGIDTYNITEFNVKGTGSSAGTDCTNVLTTQISIASGETEQITSTCGAIGIGEQYTGDIVIKYTLEAGGTEQISSGTISATAG